jgi:FlaA1/EpsC-like NDP-sugar epimerase
MPMAPAPGAGGEPALWWGAVVRNRRGGVRHGRGVACTVSAHAAGAPAVTLCLSHRIERITAQVTGRDEPLFAGDLARAGLTARVAGKRVLVVGGAGSIGAATIDALADLGPAAICVMDPNENNLAELIRSLRGRERFTPALDVAPLDYGSPLAAAWLAGQAPCDLVWSFAALKHVRSERDPFSILRMLDVNLVAAQRFLTACARHGHGRSGVFFVSTDKAADPVSLMGASKRAMEGLLWAQDRAAFPRITTTRFANVAFSDGSLPWAFLQRLEKGQPLAAPADVRRFLVSPREAGQLCLLAALACPDRHVLVPRLDAERDSVSFLAIAEAVLAGEGLEAEWYDDEASAKAALPESETVGAWPVLRTRADTAGEKAMERFVAADETAIEVGMATAQAIAAPTRIVDHGPLLAQIDAAVAGRTPLPDKDAITAWLQEVVPGLRHAASSRSLDARL